MDALRAALHEERAEHECKVRFMREYGFDRTSKLRKQIDELDKQWRVAECRRQQELYERERACAELDALRAERDEARAERDEARAERDEVRAELDEARAERDALLAERSERAADARAAARLLERF
jgi:chromosome segregation ATPase